MARSEELIETGKLILKAIRKQFNIGTGIQTAQVEWLSPQVFIVKRKGKTFTVTVKEL